MAKVIAFAPKANINKKAVKAQKNNDLFDQAMAKAKKNSGIDYYKVLTGDEKENQRLKMKQHQELLNFF